MRGAAPGRADLAALALSAILGGAVLAPGLLLRAGEGWRRCDEEALAGAAAVPEPNPGAAPLAAAAGARSLVASSVFRPDPTRMPGPPADPAAPAAASTVRDLAGRVADGRLYLRWRPAPDSTSTQFRIEGLGGPGIQELDLPAAMESVEVPVPGSSGTVLVRALPSGGPGRAAEARISIPFRIPVEAVRATAASVATGSALVALRRPFDGRMVEGVFPLHEADPVAGLSTAGPGGPVVEFRTDLVLEKIRATPAEGGEAALPAFLPDGRVARGPGGEVLPASGGGTTLEVVLRGPDDRRQVIPVLPGGR